MHDELHEFVKEALFQKQGRTQIKDALKSAGWPEDEVSAALALYAELEFPVPVPKRKVQVSAGETFRYLSAFGCLATSATALGRLLFHFVDRVIDDPLAPTGDFDLVSVRMAVASLLVAFPLYVLLAASTEKAVRRDPAKRTLGARKWLIYLSLFITGGIIIGDVITLVYGFLAGDNDVRSGLKTASLLLIAGAIFGNEFWKLKSTDAASVASGLRKAFSGVAIAAVAAAIVGGLFQAGPPGKQRDMRLDAVRSSDLSGIAYGLSQWRKTQPGGELPDGLDALAKNGSARIQDPETGESYGYRVVSDGNVELCATFTTVTSQKPAPVPMIPEAQYPRLPDFSLHGSGRQCFPVDLGPVPRP